MIEYQPSVSSTWSTSQKNDSSADSHSKHSARSYVNFLQAEHDASTGDGSSRLSRPINWTRTGLKSSAKIATCSLGLEDQGYDFIQIATASEPQTAPDSEINIPCYLAHYSSDQQTSRKSWQLPKSLHWSTECPARTLDGEQTECFSHAPFRI